MKLELEISEKVYKKLKTEVMTNKLLFGADADLRTNVLAKMFEAWDNNELPTIKFKDEK